MTIAAKHFDPQLGIDIHTYLIPPSPIPIPLPTPHIGIVLDPFDYLPIIGGTVHVNGLKRATAGTMGLDVHIPVGGAWMPPLKIAAGPQWDDELFMGSKTVLADGDPFSKITMPVLACNVVGMVAPFRIRKPKKPHLSLLLPTTLNVAIPTNVYVGGPPTVSWTALLMTFGLPALGKLLKKTGVAGAAGAAFKKLRQKLFANMKPGVLKCNILRAEPVDIRDGSVSVTQEDFAVPGRLPLAWRREYRSNDAHAGQCGRGWHTPADVRLEFDADGSALFLGPELPALFAHLPRGEGIEHAVREYVDGARLIREGAQWWVRTKDGLRYGFAADPQARSLPIQRIEDLCGNHWRFERSDGRLQRIVENGVDGLQGRFIDVESRQGRIERMQLHDPATGLNHPLVGYRYQDGDLVAAVDALDAARRFEYRQHRMIRHTDRVGLSFHYAYDARWRVVRAWGDGGLHDYKFRYDELLGETEITDSLGHVSLVKFDENGLPLCEIDPLDGVTAFEYDEVGRTTAVVDPMGLRTEFEYDGRGNLLTLTRADGGTLVTEYDPDDQALAFVEPGDVRWSQAWDERGLLIEQTTPLGAISRYQYDAAGQLRSQTDPLGATTRLEYDRYGQPQRMIDPLGAVLRLEHDATGRLLRQVDAGGQTTRFEHDAKGRVLSVIEPDGSQVRADYDGEDQLVRYVDENGAPTKLEYFGLGQIARRLQPDGHSVAYRYDTEEQLIAVVNQRGEEYRLQRDALGRIVEETDYWGQSRRYRYDASGLLRSAVDPLGQRIDYGCDAMGRVTVKTSPDPDRPDRRIDEHFRYDPLGRLVELRNRYRKVLREFDAEGRLLSEDQDGFVVANRYDSVGRRLSRETSAGNRVAYSFDLRGQLAQVAINDEAPIRIERDGLGRAIAEHLNPRVQRRLSYDDSGLLAAQAVTCDESPLFDVRYEYDRSGNVTSRRDSRHGVDRYSYDPVGRILSHTDPEGRIAHYLNDPAGDRLRTRVRETQMKRVVGGEHAPDEWMREGSFEGIGYAFDRAGNLVRRVGASSMDGSGDLVLRWDANHRLFESSKGAEVTRYGYDAMGRRVFKRGAQRTTWFFWDGDALIGEATHANDMADAPEPVRGNVFDFAAARKRRTALAGIHERAREYVYYPDTAAPLALIEKRPGALPLDRPAAAERGLVSAAQRPTQNHRVAAVSSETASRTQEGKRAPQDPRGAGGLGALGALALDGGSRKTPPRTEAAPQNGPSRSADDSEDPKSGPRTSAGMSGSSIGMTLAGRQGIGGELGLADRGEPPADTTTGIASAPAQDFSDTDAKRQWESQVYHYHLDPNGCPVRMTDARGEVRWSAEYDAWGSVAKLHAQHVVNPLRLEGQYFDDESGLGYNYFRYYDPAIGQFVSQDPLGLEAGENVYLYAPNALVWSDPLGLAFGDPASGALDRALGGTVGDNMQAHHLIPKAVWGRYASFFNRIGMGGGRDLASNGILMPDNAGGVTGRRGERVFHRGSHPNFNGMVSSKVARIQARLNSGRITPAQAKMQIESLQRSLHRKIAKGKIRTRRGCKLG